MRTADLIDSLAMGVRPARYEPTLPVMLGATAVGGVASLLLVAVIFGVQPGLGDHGLGAFAMKASYGIALGAVALIAMARLARPDSIDARWRALLIPVAVLAVIAAVQLATTPRDAIGAAMLGSSWDRCPWRIAALSLPILATLLLTGRRQAPTALRQAGAAAGLTAGAVSAAVYALACTEQSPAFVLIWYSLGVTLATGIGALAGPRLLRW